ncbi:alanyl-tRNA editing protein [uncultured Oscillibacter sp.]|uniref:alanyl-tRNA editing protein n=1 Tax=uncultured Oscillibacter sp. TaxID=876091 RepID=UPI0025DADAED|nr:alanyl-tRNA editing protein [uncultured Oscillibacter sp.]
METEKLYYENPFLRQFAATVLSCEPGKGGYLVTLDRTAFYPEGGGQPADHGTLDGIAVTDVHEKNGVIFHTCEEKVEIGTVVTGIIDWDRRFDHMQQHSGEHILSGILCDLYHCDNVGFHLGADTVTIDYNADITWEQAMAAEQRANAVIWADTPVKVLYPSQEELKAIHYRSKKELTGQVRIVAFPGADCCACCGTHVLSAGQVGIIKVLSCQKFRSGVRMEILCGKRAWRYLSAAYDQTHAIGQRLSVKPLDTAAAVERLAEELSSVKQRASSLETELFFHKAEAFRGKGDVLLMEPPMSGDSARRLADAVAKACGGLAAVFAGESGQYHYALIRADGADIAPLVKSMNAALSGRGGGRSGFAQGSVQAEEAAIRDFFNKLS